MEKDFHYDVVYALAKLTEMPRAEIVAYASQYVDDNSDEQFADGEKRAGYPERLRTEDGYFYPLMTQCRDPESMTLFVQKYVFVPFHFLPGDDHVVIRGKKNPFAVTPDSARGNRIVSEALDSGDPYRIGIALHTFGDSWSHQNFTGLFEQWNSLEPGDPVSMIGHGDAGKKPDMISESWADKRLGDVTIRNRERALEAFREIHARFRKATHKGLSWEDVSGDFQRIVDAPDSVEREKRVKDFLQSHGNGSLPPYSKRAWADEAIDRSAEGPALKSDFRKTHWFHFQQAAKAHLVLVLDLLKTL
jgi:hypothetical protein